MKKISRKGFKSGIGSELLTAAVTILAFLFFYGILELSLQYESVMQAQIVADIINDGAVSFAQNDMNLSEVAYTAMAEKIFRGNLDASEHSTFKGSMTYSLSPFEYASQRSDLFNDVNGEEFEALSDKYRGAIRSGTLETTSFDFFNNYAGNDGVKKGVNDPGNITYGVSYYGPKYMDQIATVKVESFFRFPVINKAVNREATSVILSTANDPYNGRADAGGNAKAHQDLLTLEDIAYSSVGLSEAEIETNKNVPAYNSIQQKIILEARRHLGSGYWIPACFTPWPQNMDWLGTNEAPYESGPNSYYHCAAFVNACFEKYGGLIGAVQSQPNHGISRKVTYANAIKAEDIWKEMHPDPEEVDLGGSLTQNSPRNIIKNKSKYKLSGVTTSIWKNTSNAYVRQGDTWYFFVYAGRSKGKSVYTEVSITDSTIFIEGGIPYRIADGLSYGDAVSKYCATDRPRKYKIASAEKWTSANLEVGDVIYFSDPNWRPRILRMIKELYDLEDPDQSVFAKWDSATPGEDGADGFISHVAIYIGNGKMVHSANPAKATASGNQGVFVTDVSGLEAKGEGTQMLTSVIRFDDMGSAGVSSDYIEPESMFDGY